MADGEFDKDFGYLMPFLDRIAAAASEISDPAAREELERLVGDEKERWLQIRELLSGAEEQGSGVRGRGADEPEMVAEDAIAAVTEKAITEQEPEFPLPSSEKVKHVLQFTVGSLRPGNR